MEFLVESLKNMFGPFGEVGGSNFGVGSAKKLEDNKDPEKELRKEKE